MFRGGGSQPFWMRVLEEKGRRYKEKWGIIVRKCNPLGTIKLELLVLSVFLPLLFLLGVLFFLPALNPFLFRTFENLRRFTDC
jgi:hypothetical protein